MRGIGAGTRIFDLLDRTPAIPPAAGAELDPTRRGAVKFEKITFEYPSRKNVEILRDFDLEINVGESVAIVWATCAWGGLVPLIQISFLILRGKSGGGKSSIHSLLLRYYDPVKGKVSFDGQGANNQFLRSAYHNIWNLDIREFTPTSWRAIIGVVPQVGLLSY